MEKFNDKVDHALDIFWIVISIVGVAYGMIILVPQLIEYLI